MAGGASGMAGGQGSSVQQDRLQYARPGMSQSPMAGGMFSRGGGLGGGGAMAGMGGVPIASGGQNFGAMAGMGAAPYATKGLPVDYMGAMGGPMGMLSSGGGMGGWMGNGRGGFLPQGLSPGNLDGRGLGLLAQLQGGQSMPQMPAAGINPFQNRLGYLGAAPQIPQAALSPFIQQYQQRLQSLSPDYQRFANMGFTR